jgi:hypothetical protein
MKLKVYRKIAPDVTNGTLYIDGKRFCYTLEDPVRFDGVKVYGKTAIPAGKYKVIVNMSPKFKKLLPRLIDVPNYTGVLIHGGNDVDDTLACILVGYDRVGSNKIARSASNDLVKLLLDSGDKEHEIDIVNCVEEVNLADVP